MTSPTPGVHINPDGKEMTSSQSNPALTRHAGKKIFIPLENNPEVFTDLVHRLGVSQKLGFYDVYNIDEPELLSLVPRPVHALIFISPGYIIHGVRDRDGFQDPTYSGSGPSEPVFWCKQTIGHACGLMALIHSISNGSARQFVDSGSLLDRLLQEALPRKPLPRAAVLYESLELEQAHMASASKGDTIAPSSEEPSSYHFLSFVTGDDGHLYELDGSANGPIDRGILEKRKDGLSEQALEAGVRKYVKAAEGNLEFSIVALATKPQTEEHGSFA